jgi:hypothetical protein
LERGIKSFTDYFGGNKIVLLNKYSVLLEIPPMKPFQPSRKLESMSSHYMLQVYHHSAQAKERGAFWSFLDLTNIERHNCFLWAFESLDEVKNRFYKSLPFHTFAS